MHGKLTLAAVLAVALVATSHAQTNPPPKSPPAAAGGSGGPGWGPCPGMGGMGGGMMGGGVMMGPGMGGGMMGPRALTGLNLTAQQRSEINKITDDYQKRQHQAMGRGIDLHSKLRDRYAQDKWDADAIAALYEQMGKLHVEMVRNRIDARNRIYDLLAPEQRRQYRQWGDPVPDGMMQ